jgi:hypothetical protein
MLIGSSANSEKGHVAFDRSWDHQLLSVELGELIDLLPIEGLDISMTGSLRSICSWRDGPNPSRRPKTSCPRHHAMRSRGRGICGCLGVTDCLWDARSAVDFGRLIEGALAAAVFCAPASMANKGGPENDFSVCTTWFVTRGLRQWYLIDVCRFLLRLYPPWMIWPRALFRREQAV